MKSKSRTQITPPPHCQTRQQQRGITTELINFALDYGTAYHVGSGDLAYVLDKRAVASAQLKGLPPQKARPIALIVTADGHPKTVMHILHGIPRHWRLAA